MKFEKGKVYTHKNMLDMVVYVQHAFPANKDYLLLKIKWFNRRGMDINQEETVKIYKNEFFNWYEWKGIEV